MVELEELATVVTSVGTEQEAVHIGEELVEGRLATCVNIVPCARTIYRWKGGRVCDDTEYLLFIKTPQSRAALVQDAIMRLHSYELPEVLSVVNSHVEETTRRWVVDMVQPSEDGGPLSG
jgi:periplasmic divalent cation tolerance protein